MSGDREEEKWLREREGGGYEVTPIIAYRGDNTAYLKMTSYETFS